MLTKCIDSTDVEQIKGKSTPGRKGRCQVRRHQGGIITCPAFHILPSAKMTAPGTSETSRRDPAKRHRPEKADMRLVWRSCRRISSATLGKKAHFCDRHHIAGATAVLISHSGTAGAVLSFDGFLPKAPPARGFFALLRQRSGAFQKTWVPSNQWLGERGWWGAIHE